LPLSLSSSNSNDYDIALVFNQTEDSTYSAPTVFPLELIISNANLFFSPEDVKLIASSFNIRTDPQGEAEVSKLKADTHSKITKSILDDTAKMVDAKRPKKGKAKKK